MKTVYDELKETMKYAYEKEVEPEVVLNSVYFQDGIFLDTKETLKLAKNTSLKDVIDYGIEAYFKKEIYDYSSDEDKVLGTEKEKAEALALYFEILANQLRSDYKLEKKY